MQIKMNRINLLLLSMSWPAMMQKNRAGSGHFLNGPGRVRASRFWPGSGSGRPFLASGQFGPPILAYFCPFLTNFSAKNAFFLVRAGSGHPKSGSGWVGPPKIWPRSGRATQNPWPSGQISGRALARSSPNCCCCSM